MRVFLYGFVAIAVLLGSMQAKADIYRCEDPETGIVYQETPCPEPKVEEAEEPSEAADDLILAVALAAGSRMDAARPIFAGVFSQEPRWRKMVKRLPKAGILPNEAKLIDDITGIEVNS